MLPVNILEEKLALIRSGDSLAREDLILAHRSFVARVARKVCGRNLDWDRDDELSIGLAAFNEAIDRFDESRGVPFPAFARLIIKSRITDFLRKQSRHDMHSGGTLDGGDGQNFSVIEASQAWGRHLDREAAREREEEITEYKKIIGEFGISFRDLVKSSPKHRDARANLLRVARELAGDLELFNILMTTRRLPVAALSLRLGVSAKTIERGRKYIIATSLIWHFCEDFIYLCTFIKPLWKEDGVK
ncbi:MAG: RNA polymerase sigma-I factor [Bacillota bacterium]